MNTVEKLTSTLGGLQALREMANGDRLLAAVEHWRHQEVQVDLGDNDMIQLVFNVSGGQQFELRSEDREARIRFATIHTL